AFLGLLALAWLVATASGEPLGRQLHPARGGQPEAPASDSSLADRADAPPLEANVCLADTPECRSIRALSSKAAALQSSVAAPRQQIDTRRRQMRQLAARASTVCRSDSVSANGAGDTDDCGFYRCNPVVGLCRQSCRSVDDCSQPNVCDQSDHCVQPPR